MWELLLNCLLITLILVAYVVIVLLTGIYISNRCKKSDIPLISFIVVALLILVPILEFLFSGILWINLGG